MRLLVIGLTMLSLAAWASSTPPDVEVRACTEHPTPAVCEVSKRDLQNAQQDFRRALKLQKAGKTEDAFEAFSQAARLVPKNYEYVTTREILRQRLVLDYLNSGNTLLASHDKDGAEAEFRKALALDPSNEFARQRLSTSAPAPIAGIPQLSYIDDSGELRLEPSQAVHSFHFRGDARELIQQIAKTFGVSVAFDDSFQSRRLWFDLGDANFWRTMELVCDMTHSFWTPLGAHRMLVVANNQQNRAQYQRMTKRTFYVADATSPQELTDVLNVLRTMFDIRQISQQPEASSITVRAPRPLLDAATDLLMSLDMSKPQVMLDFQVLQVNRSMLKDMGIDIPLQWQAFSLSSAALAALQQPNIQAQIDQLLASGGLTAANSGALAALVQQLQNQQSSLSGLLQNPFATFGGGLTRFAVPWPPATVHFSMNSSRVTTLQKMSLRAGQGTNASLKVGSRYPIITASYTSAYTSPAISQVLQNANPSQNQAFLNPFPSFTFEDLGLIVKAKPQIHPNDVTLDLDIELKALTGTSYNGVPVISDRTYTGTMSVLDGRTAVVAGAVDQSEIKTLSGLPGLAAIPGLNRIATHFTPQQSEGELLILITPHILREVPKSGPMIPIPAMD